MTTENKYPVTLEIDYSATSDRLTVFLRFIFIIPIAFVFLLLLDNNFGPECGEYFDNKSLAIGGIILFPTLLMILFRQKYPKWWFNFNVELVKFGSRVAAYLFLLRDEYPSTDEEQAVHISVTYPDVKKDLVQWMPLVKWLLAIPHVFLLFFLWIGVIFAVLIAWFAILFSGTMPRGIFDFVVGVMRWTLRVEAYALFLVTDEYPPFSLD